VTLAVTGNTISGRSFSTFGVTVCQRHRLPLTEVDEIYGWLVTVERRLTLCVFPVFSVAVMEKCCDACGDGEYYFRSKVSTFRVTVCQRHRLPLIGSRPDLRLVFTVERRRLSVYFLYLAWRLWKSVVTLAVTENTISGRRFRRYRVTVCQWHRLPLTEVDEIYGWLVQWKDA
jgi:hypothetical protein